MSVSTSNRSTSSANRVAPLLLATSMILAACGGGSEGTATDAPATDTPATTGVDAVDDAFAAMEADLEELEDSVDDLENNEPTTTAPPATEAPATEAPSEAADGSGVLTSASSVFTLSEMQLVAADMLGPSTDLNVTAAQMGIFSEVPTMPAASVHGLLFEIREGSLQVTHSNRLNTWSSASFDDALSFYETELAVLGYTVDDVTTSSNGDSQAGTIRINLPDTEFFQRRLTVTIRTGREGVGTTVELWSINAEEVGAQLGRFNQWAATAPIPDGAVQSTVNVSVASVGPPEAPREFWANTSVGWSFSGKTEQELRGQFAELLEASTDYALEGDITAFSVKLTSALFPKGANAQIGDSGDDGFVTLTGTWDIPA